MPWRRRGRRSAIAGAFPFSAPGPPPPAGLPEGWGGVVHRRHVDSFYVLEGELAVLVDDEEVLLRPGAFASAPPELVHGFRTTQPTRFLNFHTPDGGFAE